MVHLRQCSHLYITSSSAPIHKIQFIGFFKCQNGSGSFSEQLSHGHFSYITMCWMGCLVAHLQLWIRGYELRTIPFDSSLQLSVLSTLFTPKCSSGVIWPSLTSLFQPCCLLPTPVFLSIPPLSRITLPSLNLTYSVTFPSVPSLSVGCSALCASRWQSRNGCWVLNDDLTNTLVLLPPFP